MIERLGWTLVHFLWQGVLIAALYAVVRKWGSPSGLPPRFRAARHLKGGGRPEGLPHLRYLMACAALTAMMAAPLATFGLLGVPELSQPATRLASSAARASGAGAAILTPMSWVAAGPTRDSVLTWVVLLWLAGASAFSIRLMGGWWIATRMRSQCVRSAPPEWHSTLDRLGARIGLLRPVRLLVSALVQVPTVVGWLRPVVLVPVAALAGLPPEQVEALLAHELAHIRRRDYLVNILQSIVEALLFYHPAVWWVSGHIRAERELCCDDMAVAVTGDVLTYASALAELESNRPAHLSAALAADGGSLADRIARLLGQPRPTSRIRPTPGVIAIAVVLVITAFGLFAQSAVRTKFEVASIKPSTGQAFFFGVNSLPGGRLTANATLRLLMSVAYHLESFQILGGPAWTNSDQYQVEAKAEGNASAEQMRPMLQSLLEDRFHLTLHREARQLPVYTLVMTKSAKLQQAAKGSCITTDPNSPPPPPPPPGEAVTLPCGFLAFMGSPTGVKLEGEKVSMTDLAQRLSSLLGHTVTDKTGFTGKFDVHLQFATDAALEGFPNLGGPLRPQPAADSADPTIFVALTEQLGLRLESVKAPVEILVIDHAERPTEN